MNTLENSLLVLNLAAISHDLDIMYQFQQAFNNFIKTGQVWALLIGFVIGYIFRNFTAY